MGLPEVGRKVVGAMDEELGHAAPRRGRSQESCIRLELSRRVRDANDFHLAYPFGAGTSTFSSRGTPVISHLLDGVVWWWVGEVVPAQAAAELVEHRDGAFGLRGGMIA